jgi:outer membrane protein TolC
MKTALSLAVVCWCGLAGIFVAQIAPLPAHAETISLTRAVQLALVHSPLALEAGADEQRAYASYREARNQYLPQMMIGSGLGDSWGYPLSLEGSAPSLVNITAQSALFNPALRDFTRAAQMEYRAVEHGSRDRRDQVTQDTVLTYLELVKWEKQIGQLRQQHEEAIKMESLVKQRVQAGVDSEQTGRRAELTTARAYLRITQGEGAIDELRRSLSQLTGVPVKSLEIAADSIPELPELQPADHDTPSTEESNPAVLFAQQHAIAETFRARGEHRSLWPTVDFATQYGVLAKFNNWAQFFQQQNFERNNATVGVVIRFPFLNFSQKAHAAAADAEAIHAKQEVEATRNQVSQQALKLRRSVEQLQAAQKVSELEYEIAQSDASAVEIRINSGTATLVEGAQAQSQVSERYDALQDANFELLRARIGLMRAEGDLQSWVGVSK